MYCKVCMEGLVIRNSLVEQDCDIFSDCVLLMPYLSHKLANTDRLENKHVVNHKQVDEQICPNSKYAQQWEKSHIWAIAHRWINRN